MRMILALTFMATIGFTAFSQNLQKNEIENKTQDQTYAYAYISIEGRVFSKKLNVTVDFGDTPEQIKVGEEYSKVLTNKKSYAAILNYMVENEFELVETIALEYNSSYSGTGSGGTAGIIFIMRKKK